MAFNASQYRYTADQQKQIGESGGIPPAGTYLVYTTKVQRRFVGRKKTPQFRLFATILKVGQVQDRDQETVAESFVRQELHLDYWFDLSKRGNAQRFGWLLVACGADEVDDTDDESLRDALVDKVLRLETDVEEGSYVNSKGETVNTRRLRILEVTEAKQEAIKSFRSYNWVQDLLPSKKDQILDQYVAGANRDQGTGSAAPKQQKDEGGDSGFYDDDLPF